MCKLEWNVQFNLSNSSMIMEFQFDISDISKTSLHLLKVFIKNFSLFNWKKEVWINIIMLLTSFDEIHKFKGIIGYSIIFLHVWYLNGVKSMYWILNLVMLN